MKISSSTSAVTRTSLAPSSRPVTLPTLSPATRTSCPTATDDTSSVRKVNCFFPGGGLT